MATQEEQFALATHFYVRLKRHLNRVVDAVWMAQNDPYAREIIRLARSHGDVELALLADRYELMLTGSAPKAASAVSKGVESKVAEHYIGSLR